MLRRLLIACLAAVALAGCGGGSGRVRSVVDYASPQSASLVLDFTPNAVHVGIYDALARHDDTAAGIRLHVIVPGQSTDAIRLLRTGRVDFAILDIHDLAIARQQGLDIVGILPIVERPLAAVIAAPPVRSPRQLAGRMVGVTGAPSDEAVLRSVVAGSAGDPARVRTIHIGYNAVADLLAGRVAAATAFWNDEGVTLNRRKPGFHVFRVDDYGAPSYPELVVSATRTALTRDPGLAHALVTTLTHGYDAALANPRAAAHALESQVSGLDPHLVSAELPGLERAFKGPGGRFGTLSLTRLQAWAKWEKRFGIVSRTPDVTTMFDTAFAPR